MSQKQQTTTNKHSQGSKGRGKGNNNNRDVQSQGGGKSEASKVNTYTGNNIRTQEQKRKTVFKAVLDSPFNISWPGISIKDQNEILDSLCEILSTMKKPAKKANKKLNANNNNSLGNIDNEFNDTSTNKMDDILISIKQPPLPPSTTTTTTIRFNVFFGVNEVTKHLERMISLNRLIPTDPSSTSLTSKQYCLLEMVFVCKADAAPQLYSHFPIMCNIAGDVLLVPLPPGSSKRICDTINFKRVSCIGVKANAPEFTKIYNMVREKVKSVSASWLNPLKPPENLSNKRKIIEEEEEAVYYLKKEKLEESTPSTSDNKPKIKVEIASSLNTSSPSVFFFGQQPQVKIESTSIPTSFDYIPTQIKQLITTAPANKDQAIKKRQEKKLKYKQRK